jgi:putative glutamine amidotransferase
MPVFGVCRGHQILNVFLGGTLVIDIPSDIKNHATHQCDDYLNCRHEVNISPHTLLAAITLADSGTVTTNHHQAVDMISPALTANAHSGDHIIEGIEWKDPEGKSFLAGVQWHPERMSPGNPLSGPLAETFIRKAYEYKVNRIKPSPQ